MIGAAVLGIWMDVDGAGQDEFNAWYRGQHLSERLAVPGFLRGRRYAVAGDGPAYFTLYETAAPETLSSPAYLQRLNDPTEWTRRALPLIRRLVRNAYRLLAAGPDTSTAHLVTVRIAPASGRGPAVRQWLARDGVAALIALDGVTGCALYETETAATSVTTEERRLVGGEVVAAPPFLALCETSAPAAGEALRAFWRAWATKLAAETTVERYELLYGLAWLTR